MSPYVTRSVTRRKDQVSALVSILEKHRYGLYQLLKKEDAIEIVTTGMSCPDAIAHHPLLRDSMTMMVYAVSLNPHYANDQRMIALREEFDMFMDGVKERSDYKK